MPNVGKMYNRKVSFNVSDADHDRLMAYAEVYEKPMGELLRQLIDDLDFYVALPAEVKSRIRQAATYSKKQPSDLVEGLLRREYWRRGWK